jgi:AcrR family transcriptional regulator
MTGWHMSEPTRRERARAETDREIRHQARALLVREGQEAITLRAIARQLGITAPALYRYYSSREDLVDHVRQDICADLADQLNADLEALPDTDTVAQVFAICRGFRRWALAHPKEFTLVFASPLKHEQGPEGVISFELSGDPFGRIFLSVAGKVLTTTQLKARPDEEVPAELRDDLSTFRASLLTTIANTGLELSEEMLSLGTAYVILQFWVRLYGLIALEVFGQFPFAVSNPEPLFEIMLTELTSDIGIE